MFRIRTSYLPFFVLTLFWTALHPGIAFGEILVRCESREHQYRYCRVDTDGRVRLARTLSDAACVGGRSWGYDYRGIWVDRGCRAEFAIGRRDEDHWGGNTAGSVLGGGSAAILGTIFGNPMGSGYHGQYSGSYGANDRDIPNWAVGAFEGYDPEVRGEVRVSIYPGGSVTFASGRNRLSGSFRRNEIHMNNGADYKVQRERDGLTLTTQGFRGEELRLYRLR
jgi:hypothetical protein